ncbi:MAG: hypothetical protein GY729_05660 [Desulfobacteraceae bacterium]|nr:hypothetical protein [Desulfobacteraceae bacterium]
MGLDFGHFNGLMGGIPQADALEWGMIDVNMLKGIKDGQDTIGDDENKEKNQ